jgi:molecular chaperone Hsp33
MIQAGYQPLEMLQRALGGMPMDVVRTVTPQWYCPCSHDRVMRTLIAMGEAELRQLIEEEEETRVTCDYCAKEYVYQNWELQTLLREAQTET